MGDRFWWWMKRIRFLAACLVGGLAGFFFIYKSGFESDWAYEYIGGGIAILVTILLYYLPDWIIRLVTGSRGDDELDEWVEGFLVGLKNSGKDDDWDD